MKECTYKKEVKPIRALKGREKSLGRLSQANLTRQVIVLKPIGELWCGHLGLSFRFDRPTAGKQGCLHYKREKAFLCYTSRLRSCPGSWPQAPFLKQSPKEPNTSMKPM